MKRAASSFWLASAGAFAAARLVVLLRRFFVGLEGFYFFRFDDVHHVAQALRWRQAASFWPNDDVLPLCGWGLAGWISLFPDPRATPTVWHAVLSTLLLLLIALWTRELWPERETAPLLAAAGFGQSMLLQPMSLSAGNELDLWVCLAGALLFWTKYLKTGRGAHLAAHAVFLFFATTARYEGWLFAGIFLLFGGLELRRRRVPAFWLGAYAAAALAYPLFLAGYQELTMPSPSAPGEFSGLPLSYRGIRLFFRQERFGIVRSFWRPAWDVLRLQPVVLLVCAAGVWISRRDSAARRQAALIAAFLAACCAVAGIFGMWEWSARYLLVFYALLAPFFGRAVVQVLPGRTTAGAFAVYALVVSLGTNSWIGQGKPAGEAGATLPIARVLHRASPSVEPRILLEAGDDSGAEIPLRLASFEGLTFDRERGRYRAATSTLATRGASAFSLSREKLAALLEEKRVEWVVARSTAAAASLKGLAEPAGTSGAWTLYARSPEARASAGRLKEELERETSSDE